MMAVLLPKGGLVPAARLSKADQQVYARRAAPGMPLGHSAAGRDCIRTYPPQNGSGFPARHGIAQKQYIRIVGYKNPAPAHTTARGTWTFFLRGVLDADSKYYFWNLLFHVRMMRFLFSPAQTALYLISFGMILTFPETPGRVTLERV